MTRDMQNFKTLLVKSVFEVYATRYTQAHFKALITTSRATKLNRTAKLKVAYQPHKLAYYEVKQTAITTGNARKRVVSKQRGLGFKQTLTSQRKQSTLVRVKKRGRMKLVHGKLGFMGFLQSEHEAIFERKQKNTWFGKTRAPITELYGPSFAEMSTNYETRKKMQSWYDDNSEYVKELLKESDGL